MKIAVNIFLSIGIIRGAVLIFLGILTFMTPMPVDARIDVRPLGVFNFIVGTVILTVCLTALLKFVKRGNNLSLALVVLVLGSVVAGILLLCLRNPDYMALSASSNHLQGARQSNEYLLQNGKTHPPTDAPPINEEALTNDWDY